ncbi:MAG: hypothetical protein PHO91_02185 [Patescibacteria group bacterium]|nr:hypothetical protein [Patescibacteria group bacterium]
MNPRDQLPGRENLPASASPAGSEDNKAKARKEEIIRQFFQGLERHF